MLLAAMCCLNASAKTLTITSEPAENAAATDKKMVEAYMKVEPFETITIDLVLSVRFVQADKYCVEAQGTERLIKAIDIKVKDGQMTITSDKHYKINRGEKLPLTIYSPTLSRIVLNGVGNVRIPDKLETKFMEVVNNGVGNIRFYDLQCDELIVKSTGVGNIELAGRTEKIIITSDGVGMHTGKVQAGKRLSHGCIRTPNMVSKVTNVQMDGVGSIHCYASERIDCTNDGVGSIFYKGNPTIEHVRKTGVGSIKSK